MPKRISLTLLFTVAVAIVALFAATEAMAFNDFASAPVEEKKIGIWTVRLESVTPAPSRPGWYLWHYQIFRGTLGIDATASGVNNAAIGVIDCEQGPKTEVDIFASENKGWNDYFPLGEGTPKGFASDNLQVRALEGSPDKSIDFVAVVNTDKKDTSTILVNVKRLGGLRYEMVVPGCFDPDPQIIAGTSTTHTVTEGANSCTIEITELPAYPWAKVILVSGECDFDIAPRGKYDLKNIKKIPLRIWMQRTQSPGCWYYTLPNGVDCSVCW